MSTQGIVIIRKNGLDKGMRIIHDAYPKCVGQDVIDLIKTTDLNLLYNLMSVYDETVISEDDEEYPDEPEPFSYNACRLAVNNQSCLWVSATAAEFITNSLFCEYGYVIDLDRELLFFYVGLQETPQDRNPYGSSPVKQYERDNEYYPCRQALAFTFDYVRHTRAGSVIDDMERSQRENPHEIRYYTADCIKDEDKVQDEYSAHKTILVDVIHSLNIRLATAAGTITGCHPVSERRLLELKNAVVQVRCAIEKLEKQIIIIK